MWTAASAGGRLHDAGKTEDIHRSWEIRRPDLLLEQLAVQHPFDRPRTLLARVDGPYEQQRFVAATLLWDESAEDELERTRVTEAAMARLGFGLTRAPYREWPLVVAVVVRPGPVWFAWDEQEVWLGLRYGSNLCDVVQSDILTVTARGWVSHLDGLAGSSPRAAWSAEAGTRLAAACHGLRPTVCSRPAPR